MSWSTASRSRVFSAINRLCDPARVSHMGRSSYL
jgi:hypothetical protein